ncbi:S phase cyclin A-associated protein in the endoplasmic reticulum-like [Culicoides brevitarsis]|uniref:S phase cyclin A-associated protein in the endoplasmic reticulum-like n=1 Tax=Culicoides brevitarsis TaxID=469753 RepID=UPI00307CBDBC
MPEIKENDAKIHADRRLSAAKLCHSEDESLNSSSSSSVRNVVSSKKPPIVTKIASPLLKKESTTSSSRVRSASAGRDKRSELQARYWAFLFGNLQRAIDELYTTVECYGSMSSCKEVILVLENYIRDFKSLAEWFQVSSEYENTPLPQRPHSLAWEVRKSNPVPRVRIKTLASPKSISGKSSPNYSGKNSPCPIIEENSVNSPKRTPSESKLAIISHNNASMLQGSKELIHINHTTFENFTNGEIVCHDMIALKSSIIPESISQVPVETQQVVEQINLAVDQENNIFNCVMDVIRLDKSSQTDLPDGDLTLAEYLEKYDKCLIASENPKIEEIPKTEEKLPVEEKKKPPVTAKYSSVVSKNLPSRAATMTNGVHGRAGHQGILKKTVVGKIIPKTTNSSVVSSRQTRSVKLRDNLGAPKNVENRLSARSKTMIEINSNKNPVNTQKSRVSELNRLSKSRESLGSSTSTLKASTDRLLHGSSKSSLVRSSLKSDSKAQSSSSETITGNDSGWQTVKNRRRFSSHWANRFNQPSGYASLPSLALLNEEKPEKNEDEKLKNEKSVTKDVKSKTLTEVKKKPVAVTKPIVPSSVKTSSVLAKTTQKPKPEAIKSQQKSSSSGEIKRKVNSAPTTRTPAVPVSSIKRQKSDLTGLKLKSLRKEYLRSEKLLNLQKNSSSPEKRSKNESSNESNSQTDDEKQSETSTSKIDMKIQTGSEILNKLYVACLGQSRIDRDISSCDDEQDIESDDDQKKILEAKQESLERELRELQNTEIDVDTETDETDCETLDLMTTDDQCDANGNDEDMTLEDRYEAVLSDMSWVERLETLATLQAIHARHPGRAQQLHQKLSNPSRCLSLTETLKKYQAKQARALEKRQALQKDKAVKIQNLLARVEEVKNQKQQLIDEKRIRMESRLKRAAENRTQYLRDKIRKAHDEEEKLKEIAFIKSLEAQNKRIDFMESCREQEGRLQDLEQERIKRMEEKAAKEAAVEKRRQELEAQRQQRLEKMSETRREREKRVGKMQAQREQQRQHAARAKAKDRETRLQALQAQQIATTEELQRKILQKQQESARRHEENIEHIRQRALEMTIPIRSGEETTPQPGQRSSISGDGTKPGTKYCSDKSKELVKTARKRLKKIKQRMALAAADYLAEMQPLPAHVKKDSQVHKLLNMITKGGGPLGIERPLGQLLRQISKAEIADFQSMWLLDGLGTISNIIQKGMQDNSDISKRAVVLSVQLYRNSCSSCPQIARHAILGNTIVVLFDALLTSLQTPEEKSPLYPVELSTELILACTVALSPSNSLKQANPKVLERLPDLIRRETGDWNEKRSINVIQLKLSRSAYDVKELELGLLSSGRAAVDH